MYYTIVTTEQLSTKLPAAVVKYMGYTKTYTLGEACFGEPRPLADGRYLINVQLSNREYVANRCVLDEIKPAELEMARQFYGSENILTEADIEKLEFKTEILTE